jgi:hypothetical protein
MLPAALHDVAFDLCYDRPRLRAMFVGHEFHDALGDAYVTGDGEDLRLVGFGLAGGGFVALDAVTRLMPSGFAVNDAVLLEPLPPLDARPLRCADAGGLRFRLRDGRLADAPELAVPA